MLIQSEWQETVAHHSVQSCGPLPTVCDEEGIYPYESFCETAKRPNLRKLRMIAIENKWLKVTVCPDLGGKIHAIMDKTTGKELLFNSGSVRPVRILPRMAFISGGIEVSFPIAHTPVQMESVHSAVQQIEDRLYIWCGERELRYGMQWTVEFSLGVNDRFLTQRACFFNPTSESHAWMSWSNAALPARADSQFYFPTGRVLRHADILEEIDWDGNRSHSLSEFDRMQGFFWKTANCNAFGMFTESLGSGLYHIADPAETPGIKLWLYGLGRDEEWAHQTAAQQESYVEIQAGPLLEQADNRKLRPGERHTHTEFWIPASQPMNINELALPAPCLMDLDRIPLFDWVARANTAVWLELMEACHAGHVKRLPAPPACEDCNWPPSGMEGLGEALQYAADRSEGRARTMWLYYLGVWLAGRSNYDEAMRVLCRVETDESYALLGRLYRVVKQDFAASRVSYNRISSLAWNIHPQVVVERDITLSHFGHSAFSEREQWFTRVAALKDDGVIERKAYYLYDSGDLHGARLLLEQAGFEKVHQRYSRTHLWNLIHAKLGEEKPVPALLGEDDLAMYGAYRVHDSEHSSN